MTQATTCPHAAQFEADLRSVMADLGESTLGIPLPPLPTPPEGEPEPENPEGDDPAPTMAFIPCLARDHGHERVSPDVGVYSGQRARIATAIVFARDVPGCIMRGDVVHLFGVEWQVRSARSMGFGLGQAIRLTLAADEKAGLGARRA